jgi:ribosomal-protein-alanine N-acetyltransferase
VTLIPITIEPVKAEQLLQLVELDRLCLQGLWTLDGYQRELDSPNSTLLVVSFVGQETKESIVGMGCFWAILEEAHITILAVHPDFQRQGLGQLILSALLRDAKERNLERATLEVRDSNEVALSLYEKFGFKIAGRRKRYYQKTGEDALILWRNDLAKSEFEDALNFWEKQVCHRLSQHSWQLLQV